MAVFTYKQILKKYPLTKLGMERSSGYFQHNKVPLEELCWNEDTLTATLILSILPEAEIGGGFTHGGYSSFLIDGVGAFSASLLAVAEDKFVRTSELITTYPRPLSVTDKIKVVSVVHKHESEVDTLIAVVEIISMRTGKVCVSGKVSVKAQHISNFRFAPTEIVE
jgi:acyl-coenzyme A thioesterase PaaI-like protein